MADANMVDKCWSCGDTGYVRTLFGDRPCEQCKKAEPPEHIGELYNEINDVMRERGL